MRFTDSARQPILGLRNDNEMDVIWHEAVAEDLHPELSTVFSQQVSVVVKVAWLEKGLLSPVSALRDMMWVAWKNDSGNPWHDEEPPSACAVLFLYRSKGGFGEKRKKVLRPSFLHVGNPEIRTENGAHLEAGPFWNGGLGEKREKMSLRPSFLRLYEPQPRSSDSGLR